MAQERWLIEGAKTIDVGLVRRLKVGLLAGNIDIIAHDESTARIEVHSVSGKPLKISIEGDQLEIDHPQIGWDNWLEVFRSSKDRANADISVAVPRDVALKMGVVSATALVSGLRGDATISTVSGDIVIDGVSGDLQLNAVSGELQVSDHHGKVSAKTVNGGIAVTGEVISFTGDGVNGDMFLDLIGVPDRVRVNTVSGDITARLLHSVATSYVINTVSGRLQIDGSEVRGVRGHYESTYGELDGRWLDFKANTVSGDVSVLHTVTA